MSRSDHGSEDMILPKNTLIPSELLYPLEEQVAGEADDVFGLLYNESNPERMLEEMLEIVRLCGLGEDIDDLIREYFDLAEHEEDTQAFFHDGDRTLTEIYRGMIKDEFCWIGILYRLDHDVSGYVSDIIDALNDNSDAYGFEEAVDSLIWDLQKDIEDGEPGRWFA